MFNFFNRNRPSKKQRNYLRDLGVKAKPKTKEDASSLISDAIWKWEQRFADQFESWPPPREIERAILVYAKRSPLDRAAQSDQTISETDLEKIITDATGPKCLEIVKGRLEDYDFLPGFEYIHAFVAQNCKGTLPDSDVFEIIGHLADSKLTKQLETTGYNYLLWGWSSGRVIFPPGLWVHDVGWGSKVK